MESTRTHYSRLVMFALAVVLIVSAALPGGAWAPVAQAESPEEAVTTQQDGSTSYLPLVLRRSPWANIFGSETGSFHDQRAISQLAGSGATWIRKTAVWWPDVQPTEGRIDWQALSGLEAELRAANAAGLKVILVVRGTPAWAQKDPGWECGPIRADKFAAFAGFMSQLVQRYRYAPYNVRYFELGNEPDIARDDPAVPYLPSDCLWGCWGEYTDPYYGGAYYAEMLKAVYPAIKAANPASEVLIGGLLMDCDPDNLPAGKTSCHSSKFLEGILAGGGAPYFDGISFHAYDYYYLSPGDYRNPNWHSTWNTTGPVLITKTRYIKSILAAYGVEGKELYNTEAAVLCDQCTTNPGLVRDYEATKAYYVAQAYSAALSEGLRANLWYSIYGWRSSGLLNADGTPKPAMRAFVFARQKLGHAQFVREVNELAGVRGYEFTNDGRTLWVVWSADGRGHSVTLPRGAPVALHDALGDRETAAGATVTVTIKPLYIEW